MHGNGFDLLADRRDGRLNAARHLDEAALDAELARANATRGCRSGKPDPGRSGQPTSRPPLHADL